MVLRFRIAPLARLVASFALLAVFQSAEAQGYGFFRYDDDFSSYSDPAVAAADDPIGLKFIRLGDQDAPVLSFGADDREKAESYDHPQFGLTHAPGYVAWMHRLLLNGNLQTSNFRLFVELGNHDESSRRPGPLPTDIDRGDLQQAFVDVTASAGAGRLTLRVGRQEMSYGEGLLVGVRDGPNIRQDWDGIRAFWSADVGRLDVFAVHPVENFPGYFDDTEEASQTLWGTYLTLPAKGTQLPFNLDAYYFGSINDRLRLSFGSAHDERSTFGLRTYWNASPWDGIIEPILQYGTFGGRSVDAFAFHSELGWTATNVSWTPRVGGKFDVLSGNRHPDSGSVSSFNPLYPNLSYSTEATIEAATNLIQLGTTLTITPAARVSVSYEYEGLWRDSTADAFYVAPLIPLVPPGKGSNQRFVGTEQQISANWRANDHLAFKVSFVQFTVGDYIRNLHGSNEQYAMGWVSLRY